MNIPPAGSIGLVKVEGLVGDAIRVAQLLNDDGFADYEHAFVLYGAGPDVENSWIIEAEGGGVVSSRLSKYEGRKVLWLDCPPVYASAMTAAAIHYIGVPYSYTDYFAIAAHTLSGGPVSRVLKDLVDKSHHVICSQLAAACADKAGWPLLPADLWPGYVTPAHLAGLAGPDVQPEVVG